MSENLAEALPREIARVMEIKAIYEQLGRDSPRTLVGPQIAMMDAEIKAAIKACAEGDLGGMIRAVAALKEWEP